MKFNIHEVLNALYNIKNETVNSKNEVRYMVVDASYSLPSDGKTEQTHGLLLSADQRLDKYFANRLEFHPTKPQNITAGITTASPISRASPAPRVGSLSQRLPSVSGSRRET